MKFNLTLLSFQLKVGEYEQYYNTLNLFAVNNFLFASDIL